MRNSLFFQISLVNLLFIIIFSLIVQQNTLLTEPFNNWIIAPLYAIIVTLMTLSAVLISSRFVKPIKIISAQISEPEKLEDLFYSNSHLPSEIQRLLLAIIQYQARNDGTKTDYHTERKMFYSLLENMKDGILITDESGIVRLVNQATRQLFNIGEGEIIGSTLAESLRDHRVNEMLQQCSASHQQQSTTIEISSTKSFIHCTAAPLFDGQSRNILFLFQDLTRVHQLEIIRRDFVSNVSHELRTPLASLKLITETLQDGALNDPPAANRFLKQMDNEVDNLTQMVEELLELSRIESGQVPLDRQWIKPEELVHTAGIRMAMQAERAGLEFSYGCDAELPAILVDSSRLSQVLLNLIHNAIKFTPPGGRIELSAIEENNHVIFFVKDNGVGIPEKDLERIFERFYKSDRSRTQHGTGLGLSISKHLVEKHGGKIWVESSFNAGSTFKFSIPISPNI